MELGTNNNISGDDKEGPHGKMDGEGADDNGGFRHIVPGQHYWHGTLYSGSIPGDTLENLAEFDIYDDDCIVSGYPKSGTTWLEEMIYLVYNKGNTSLANQMPNYVRVPLLEDPRTTNLCQNQTRPRIFKSHLRFGDLPLKVHTSKAKIIHVLRNPKDVAVSYFYFYQSLTELGSFNGSWDEYFKMFTAGHVICGSWFQYVNSWWENRDNPNILFLRYEDMLAEPVDNIKKIADFCGKELSDDQVRTIIEHCSFKSMKNNPMTNFSTARAIDATISPFMRKGVSGDWKCHFTSEQSAQLDSIMQSELSNVQWFQA